MAVTPARVLVVEDEAPLRRLLRHYLDREGFAVLEADNGLDALSLVRSGGVDLALVDVMLPELDGFELVRRIRRVSTLPIILLTARASRSLDRGPGSLRSPSCAAGASI